MQEPEAPVEWTEAPRPGEVVGRYALVRELGRGAFGVVYLATDTVLSREVAFKVVRPGHGGVAEEQLQREAEIISHLAHPNLVTLFDAGRCDHGPFLVLELLRGTTLKERLTPRPLEPAEALRLGVEAARGLAHAHARGVVHRDLKPSNVFLCEDGAVKVLDFGLSHAFGRRRVDGGTPAYMAPEQWRGAPEDERTDVFALGVLLFRLLSGELPFPDEAGRAVTSAEPSPRLTVPAAPGLGELVGRMIAKDPVDRPRDAAQVLEELEPLRAALAPSTTGAGTSSVRLHRPRFHRPRRATLAAAALTVAAAALLATLALIGPWRPGAPAAGPSPDAPPSVAVLPFADLSPQRDQAYFAEGLADEIQSALGQVPGLLVAGRTSAFAFKGKDEDVRAIGRQLGVGAVLQGSVRLDGTRVRITAQLVGAGDGFQLWSRSYDRELTSVFAVQDEISRAVVEALRIRLLAWRTPASRGLQTSDPRVYDHYLRGLRHARGDTQEEGRLAVQAFDAALALDPAYAPAWAHLAKALYFAEANQGEGPAQLQAARERALAAAEKAVALAPDLADAYAARALLRISDRWDWAGGQADLERALALNPGDSEIQQRYARDLLGPLGRLPEALAAARRATQLDPLWASTWTALSSLHLAEGRLDLARQAAQRALELLPTGDTAPTYLATVELLEGRPAAALEAARRCTWRAFRLQLEAVAYHDLGDRPASQAALDELVATGAADMAYQIATVHAWRGEADLAFQWLERAFTQRDAGLMDVKIDPLLRKVRGDPRFAALLGRLGLPPG